MPFCDLCKVYCSVYSSEEHTCPPKWIVINPDWGEDWEDVSPTYGWDKYEAAKNYIQQCCECDPELYDSATGDGFDLLVKLEGSDEMFKIGVWGEYSMDFYTCDTKENK